MFCLDTLFSNEAECTSNIIEMISHDHTDEIMENCSLKTVLRYALGCDIGKLVFTDTEFFREINFTKIFVKLVSRKKRLENQVLEVPKGSFFIFGWKSTVTAAKLRIWKDRNHIQPETYGLNDNTNKNRILVIRFSDKKKKRFWNTIVGTR